jgi:hypothetical protein
MNEKGWIDVSRWQRPNYKPGSLEANVNARTERNPNATSNVNESLNGHLDRVTPRSNRFCGSLVRLLDACLRKGQTFHHSFKHNYQYQFRKSLQKQHAVAENQVASEIAFVETANMVCLCSETQFTSNMYRIALPCIHQFAVRFQAMPDLIQHHFGGINHP